MDDELYCDFYFGHKVTSEIKKLDYNQLKNFKKEVRNHWIFGTTFIWQFGVWHLIFKRYKYFILTGEPSILSNWVIIVLGRILGKKVMVWSHGMKGDPNVKADWFELYFYKLCSTVLLYGNHSRNIMLQRGFKEEKLICIYNSLNHVRQLEIRASLSKTNIFNKYFNNNDPVLIYVGRIQRNKNLELLIKAHSLLNQRNINCNLVFVGRDLGDNKVQALAKRNKVSNKIFFYGPCYDEAKLGELIYNANVCVSPGPIGLTAIHSLTYGTPAISNDDFYNQMPEYQVIKDGKTGSFYKNLDFEDLCEKIKLWIEISEEKRELIRQNCYTVIDEKWNPSNQLRILYKAINSHK